MPELVSKPDELRTEPAIDVFAVQKHMPEGFPVIDPDTPLGQVQLAGVPIRGFASAHLAASNRALWRRVAELEAEKANLEKAHRQILEMRNQVHCLLDAQIMAAMAVNPEDYEPEARAAWGLR